MKKKILVPLALFLLAAAALPAAAFAHAGALDRSFGHHGRVAIGVSAGEGEPGYAQKPRAAQMAMDMGPRGGVAVASGRSVYLRRSDGRPARRFGGDGVIAIEPPAGWKFELADLAVDAQGRVLAAGTLASATVANTQDPPEYNEGKEAHGPQPRLGVVFRYLPDGQPDPSFDGDGVLIGSFGQRPPTGPGPFQYEYSSPAVGLTGLAVAPAGDLVLTGYAAAHVTGGCYPPITGATGRSFLARLNPDGTLETGFGAGGVVTAQQFEHLDSTTLDASGRIAFEGVVGGYCGVRGPAASRAIVSLRANGSPDTSFGENGGGPDLGLVPMKVTFDSRGRLLVLGHRRDEATPGEGFSTPGWRVKRLLANGKPDPSFGRRGASPKLPPRTILEDITVDGQGRIALAGYDTREDGTAKRFLLTRLSAAGKREPGFGRHGWTATAFGGLSPTGLEVAAARGRILIGGILARPDEGRAIVGLAIARYLGY